jgi:hypothetical protein
MPIHGRESMAMNRGIFGLLRIAITTSLLTQLGVLTKAQVVSGRRDTFVDETTIATAEHSPASMIKRPPTSAVLSATPATQFTKKWLILSASSITAGYLDTVSTIRIENYYQHGFGDAENDPLARPFAALPHPAYVAATGVLLVGLAAVSQHMQHTANPFIRRVWWVPQTAQSSVSFGLFIRNERGWRGISH